MESNTYYGEYSLEHWIELIMKKNIRLPWFQRSFVWNKNQIEGLVRSLEEGQFVPPVIIGAVKDGDVWKNYYFLREDLKNFFAPDFLSNVKVDTSSKESGMIDFIKYLSILAQYKSDWGLRFYGGRDWEKNEKYYREYIFSIVNNCQNHEYGFDISFPENPYSNDRMEKLERTVSKLELPHTFSSIIDLDMYFFGVVNEVVFYNRDIDVERRNELKKELEDKISEWKNEGKYRKNPNALKYLKLRIAASMEIYDKYTIR